MTTTTDGRASYSYDTTNQVTGATYTTNPGATQPANEAYSFDSNGNRTNTGYSTGTNNQLSSDGTFNYTYDAEGNRTSRTRISGAAANDYLTTYTWDYRDRLEDVDFYNNSSVLTSHIHYTYDVYDRRISKSLDSTGSGSYSRIEDYVYDGDHVALDFVDPDGAGPSSLALAARYLNGPSNSELTDQVFAQENASTGAVSWLLSDNLGTTRDVVNNSSTLLGHFVYNSFGQLASGPTNLTRFLYTGEEWDADAGLQYNRHRWYDPAVGRWISQDPTGFGATDPNLNRYAGNSSSNAADPSGLEETPAGNGSEAPPDGIINELPDPIITIFVSQNGLPSNFNASAVQAQLQQMVDTAGVGIQIGIITTSTSPSQLGLGYLYTQSSWWYNTPCINYVNPIAWVVLSLHDAIGYPLTNQNLSYTHYIHFSNTTLLNAIAMTGSYYQTVVNPQSIQQNLAGTSGPVNYDVLYGNILAHEALYLGAMGNYDDPAAPAGTLGSNSASSSAPLALTEEEAEELADDMDGAFDAAEE